MAVREEKGLKANWGAWVWIKWKQGTPEDACMDWKDIKEIKEAWSTTGEWDCALWLDVADPNEIERIVWKEIPGHKWVEKTDTHWLTTNPQLFWRRHRSRK